MGVSNLISKLQINKNHQKRRIKYLKKKIIKERKLSQNENKKETYKKIRDTHMHL